MAEKQTQTAALGRRGVEIHPEANVAPDARLGDGVKIGAHVTVLEGAVIGGGTHLGPATESKPVWIGPRVEIGLNGDVQAGIERGVHIYDGAKLGSGVRVTGAQVHTGVVVGHGCQIDEFASIRPGVVMEDGSRARENSHVTERCTLKAGAVLREGCTLKPGTVVRAREAPEDQGLAARTSRSVAWDWDERVSENHDPDHIERDISAQIHPDAVVDPRAWVAAGAVIERGVVLEANVVIAENARIGEGTRIAGLTYVGEGAQIGANGKIASYVGIGESVVIGARVTIAENAAIEEFTRIGDDVRIDSQSAPEVPKEFPNSGNLSTEIEARCEIGNRVTIGTDSTIGFGTVIKDDVTIGALCRTGHGTLIEERARLGRLTTFPEGAVTVGEGVELPPDSGVDPGTKLLSRNVQVPAREGWYRADMPTSLAGLPEAGAAGAAELVLKTEATPVVTRGAGRPAGGGALRKTAVARDQKR